MTGADMELEWPIKSKTATYVIGSPRTIALFEKNKENARIFIKDLRKLDEMKVRRTVKFVTDVYAEDKFIYIMDYEGLQLVIEIERDEDPIDISKYDA